MNFVVLTLLGTLGLAVGVDPVDPFVDPNESNPFFSGPNMCCTDMKRDEFPPEFRNCGGDRYAGLPFSKRSTILARNGAAASSHPLVTQTMIEVLRNGGNAIDAAIAGNALQGVVEPNMNGIGGDLFAQVWDPKTQKLYGLNGSGRSPFSLSLEEMLARVGNAPFIPEYGPLPVSVPGAVDAWFELNERFGSKPISELLQRAIEYAEDGHAIHEVIASDMAIQLAIFESPETFAQITSNGRFPNAFDEFKKVFLNPDGTTLRAGQIFHNRDLGQALRAIARGGRDAYYRGPIARRIVDWAETVGVALTFQDFAQHSSTWVEPFSTNYRGYDIWELPPNTQGFAALIMLNILEGFNLTEFGHNSADYIHAHVEAKKLAFADRAKYFADPDFNDLDYTLLLDKGYAAQRRSMINFEQAALSVQPGDPFFQLPRLSQKGDTVYISVADRDGMMVSLIQSNFDMFGSGLVPTNLGFPMQNRGGLFNLDPNTFDAYAPHKRPFHTIIPGFITKDGLPLMSFGVMGGAIQPQGHVQIVANLVDFNMTVQEAGDAARYVHDNDSDVTGKFMTDGGILSLESGVCSSVRLELLRRGHVFGPAGVFHFGGYQGIWKDPETQVYFAATEFRKDGQAAGF